MASFCMLGWSSMALFTRTAKLDPGSARCAWAVAVHHAVGISRQRNSGYRPSRINIMAQGLSTPESRFLLSPTHLTIRRGRATITHYTHYHVSLMVSRNTTLVPSLGLCIGPACETGLSASMWREHVSPQIRKKELGDGSYGKNAMGMIHRPIVTSYMFHLWQHSCHCLHSSNQLPKIPYNVNWSITSEAEIIFRSQSQKSGQLLEVYLLRMFLWWQSDHNAKPASCCCSKKLKLNFTKFCHSVTPVIRTQYLWPPIACINFFGTFASIHFSITTTPMFT